MRWAEEGGSGSRSGQESSAWGLGGTLDPTVADVFCLSAWGRAPDWIVFHFGVFPKILLSILRANGLSIMSPGGFQPLGKGTTLTCLSRCDHSSPAGLWIAAAFVPFHCCGLLGVRGGRWGELYASIVFIPTSQTH